MMEIAEKFLDYLDDVRFQNYSFAVTVRGNCIYLQASFVAPHCRTGVSELQHTRQWLLHPQMTRSEVVQTAFKLVLTSIEHEARESFHYKGQPIFGPHFDVDALHGICDVIDVRAAA